MIELGNFEVKADAGNTTTLPSAVYFMQQLVTIDCTTSSAEVTTSSVPMWEITSLILVSQLQIHALQNPQSQVP